MDGFKDNFLKYFDILYNGIPTSVYEGLLSVLCIVFTMLVAFKGLRKGLYHTARFLLAEYIFLIFCSAVIFRTINDYQGYNNELFWSYSAILDGQEGILIEIILNVLVFIPVGILLCCSFYSIEFWKVIFVGWLISFIVEGMQLILKRGYWELDDMVHNIIGCILGYILYSLIRKGYNRCFSRRLPTL